MWTKRALFIVVHFRIKTFHLPIAILPFRCFNEVVGGAADLLALFRPLSGKVLAGLVMVQQFFEELQSYGRLDLVDVRVKKPDESVHIRFLLR